MESFLYLFVAFSCGVVFNIFWGYILGLGYGIMSYQQTTADCIRFSRFVEFHDWDSAMNYLNDIYNGGRS